MNGHGSMMLIDSSPAVSNHSHTTRFLSLPGKCVSRGAQRVIIAPYFLSRGRHIQEDIPALVAEARALYPDITLTVAEPIGGCSTSKPRDCRFCGAVPLPRLPCVAISLSRLHTTCCAHACSSTYFKLGLLVAKHTSVRLQIEYFQSFGLHTASTVNVWRVVAC